MGAAAALPALGGPAAAAGSVLIRCLEIGLLTGIVGSLGVIGLVLRPGRFRGSITAAVASLHAEHRLLGWATACAATALVAGTIVSLLDGTRWGALWLAHEGMLALVLALVVRMRHARTPGSGRFARAPGSAAIVAALLLVGAAMVVR